MEISIRKFAGEVDRFLRYYMYILPELHFSGYIQAADSGFLTDSGCLEMGIQIQIIQGFLRLEKSWSYWNKLWIVGWTCWNNVTCTVDTCNHVQPIYDTLGHLIYDIKTRSDRAFLQVSPGILSQSPSGIRHWGAL